ncbi:MAG: aldo/keto reductase [Nitratireductor sp.]
MVGSVALGCMSFAGFYGATTQAQAHETLAAALDLGVTHLDTARIYGDGLSEEIIGSFLRNNPVRFSIATKVAFVPSRHGDLTTRRNFFVNASKDP